MTDQDLETEVFRRLEESSTDPEFWEALEVRSAINDGWEELALHAEWYLSEWTIPLQDETTYYDLRDWAVDEPLSINAVWNETLSRWLEPTSELMLDETVMRQWEAANSAAHKFFVRGCFTLGVFGKPDIGDNSEYLTILATAVPQLLTFTGQTIPHPEEFCEAEILYALYDLKCQEGEVDLGLGYWKQYLAHADRMKEWAVYSINHAIKRGLRG